MALERYAVAAAALPLSGEIIYYNILNLTNAPESKVSKIIIDFVIKAIMKKKKTKMKITKSSKRYIIIISAYKYTNYHRSKVYMYIIIKCIIIIIILLLS